MSDRPSDTTLTILNDLISFATVSDRSNLELISYAEDHLTKLGYRLLKVPNEAGTKANLYATIGPDLDGGVVLSGHTDVVPVEGQDWTTDPFQMEEKDGKLYGRGTSDMKGFVACILGKAAQFAATDLTRPIHLALSYDEEIGCLGVRPLVDTLNALPTKPAMCLVGEPTDMKVISSHKGKHSVTCTVTGMSGHSSLPGEGVNAVEYAAELIVFLRALNRRFRDEGPHTADFEPPHTTVHTGPITGGTQLNIIPEACAFDYEFRMLPGHEAEGIQEEIEAFVRRDLEPQMKAVNPATGFKFDIASSFPGLATPDEAEVTKLAMELTGANRTSKVSFGTEAGVFSMIGDIPTVVCGPGSITQAHKPNEFVSLDQLARCETFLDRLTDRLRAS